MNNRLAGRLINKSAVVVTAAILIGLILTNYLIASPLTAITLVSVGTALAFTVFIRRIDYLVFAWFTLSWLMYWIASRFPADYQSLVIRSIFWGLLFCMNVSWLIDTILTRRKPIPFDDRPITAIIFTSLLWSAILVFITPSISRSMITMSRILIALITSYVLYDFLSRDENNIRRLLTILSVIVILISFGTLIDACRRLISGALLFKTVGAVLLNNPLGYFLFISSSILITSGFNFKNNKELKTFLIAVLILALFLSFSRTCWLAALVSFSFLLWRSGRKVPLVIAMILILLISMALFVGMGKDFYRPLVQEGYGLTGTITLTARWEGAKLAWPIICDRPLLGYGVTMKVPGQHSIYLITAVKSGLPSLVLIFIFYVVFFYSSARIEKALKSQYLKSIVTGSMATLLGFIFYGLFENIGILTDYGAVGWNPLYPYVIAVLPFAAKKIEERQEVEDSDQPSANSRQRSVIRQ